MLLHSDVARLVLGYLAEENCNHTYQSFLKESIHLRSIQHVFSEEVSDTAPITIFGKSLYSILDDYFNMKDAEMQIWNFKNRRNGKKHKFLAMWKKLEDAVTAVKSVQVASVLDGLQMNKSYCKNCEMSMTDNGVVITPSTPVDMLFNHKRLSQRTLHRDCSNGNEMNTMQDEVTRQLNFSRYSTSTVVDTPLPSTEENRRKKTRSIPKRLSDIQRRDKESDLRVDQSSLLLQSITGSETMAVVGATIMTQMKKYAQAENTSASSTTNTMFDVDADSAKQNHESIAQLSLESLLQSDFSINEMEFGKELEELLGMHNDTVSTDNKLGNMTGDEGPTSTPDGKASHDVTSRATESVEVESPGNAKPYEPTTLLESSTVAITSGDASTSHDISPPCHVTASASRDDYTLKPPTSSCVILFGNPVVVTLPKDLQKAKEDAKQKVAGSITGSGSDVAGGSDRSSLPGNDLVPSTSDIVQVENLSSLNSKEADGKEENSSLLSPGCSSDQEEIVSAPAPHPTPHPTPEKPRKGSRKHSEAEHSHPTPQKSLPLWLEESPAKNTRSQSNQSYSTSSLKKSRTPRIRIRSNKAESKRKSKKKSAKHQDKKKRRSEKTRTRKSAEPSSPSLSLPTSDPPASPLNTSPQTVLSAVSLQRTTCSPRKLTLRYGLRSTEVEALKNTDATKSKAAQLVPDSLLAPTSEPPPPSLRPGKDDLLNSALANSQAGVPQNDDGVVSGLTEMSNLTHSELPTVNHPGTASNPSQSSVSGPTSSGVVVRSYVQPSASIAVAHDSVGMDDIIQQLTEQVRKSKGASHSTTDVTVASLPVSTGMVHSDASAFCGVAGLAETELPRVEEPISAPIATDAVDAQQVHQPTSSSIGDKFDTLCRKTVTGDSLTVLLNETSLTQALEAAKNENGWNIDLPTKSSTGDNRDFKTISPSAGIFSIFDDPVMETSTAVKNIQNTHPLAPTFSTLPSSLPSVISVPTISFNVSTMNEPSETEIATQNLRAWLNNSDNRLEIIKPNRKSETVCRTLDFTKPGSYKKRMSIKKTYKKRKILPKQTDTTPTTPPVPVATVPISIQPVRSVVPTITCQPPMLHHQITVQPPIHQQSLQSHPLPSNKLPGLPPQSVASFPNPTVDLVKLPDDLGKFGSIAPSITSHEPPGVDTSMSKFNFDLSDVIDPLEVAVAACDVVIASDPSESEEDRTKPTTESQPALVRDLAAITTESQSALLRDLAASINTTVASSLSTLHDLSVGSSASLSSDNTQTTFANKSLRLSTKPCSPMKSAVDCNAERRTEKSKTAASKLTAERINSPQIPVVSSNSSDFIDPAKSQDGPLGDSLSQVAHVACKTDLQTKQATANSDHLSRAMTSDEDRITPPVHRKRKSSGRSSPKKKPRLEKFAMSDLREFLKEVHGQGSSKTNDSPSPKSETSPQSSSRGISGSSSLKPSPQTTANVQSGPDAIKPSSKPKSAGSPLKKLKKNRVKSLSASADDKTIKRRVSLTSIPIPRSKLGGSPMHLRTPSPPVRVCRDSPKTIALVAESLVELSRGSAHERSNPALSSPSSSNTSKNHSTSRTGSDANPSRRKKKPKKRLTLENVNISEFLSTIKYN